MMLSLRNVVSTLLHGRTDVCYLCFNHLEIIYCLHDEVIMNTGTGQETMELAEIFNFLLGTDFQLPAKTSSVCATCTKTALDSYRFISMCQINSENLSNALDTLSDCLETNMEDLHLYKSLVVSIDIKHRTSEQYFDVCSSENSKQVLKRFKSMISMKRKLKNDMKQKKKKLHNFKPEILEICDLIIEPNTPTKFKCKVCENVFKKSFNFKKHYYSQHSAKILKCSECPRSYGSMALLKQHKYDCHSSLICNECGKTYTNRYSLLYHKRQHTGEHPYQCSFCGMKFQWSSRKAEHERRFHMEPGVVCNICNSKFRTLGSLYEHRKRHFNPNSRLHVPHDTEVVEEVIIETIDQSVNEVIDGEIVL